MEWMSSLAVRLCGFTSRDAFNRDTGVQLLDKVGFFIDGVFPIYRSVAPLPTSLAESSANLCGHIELAHRILRHLWVRPGASRAGDRGEIAKPELLRNAR